MYLALFKDFVVIYFLFVNYKQNERKLATLRTRDKKWVAPLGAPPIQMNRRCLWPNRNEPIQTVSDT
jgi:hypothetical protein